VYKYIILGRYGVWSIIVYGNILRWWVRERSKFVEKIFPLPDHFTGVYNGVSSLTCHVKYINTKKIRPLKLYIPTHFLWSFYSRTKHSSNTTTINYNDDNYWKVKYYITNNNLIPEWHHWPLYIISTIYIYLYMVYFFLKNKIIFYQ